MFKAQNLFSTMLFTTAVAVTSSSNTLGNSLNSPPLVVQGSELQVSDIKVTSLLAKQPSKTTLPLAKQSPHGLNREISPVGNYLTKWLSGCSGHPSWSQHHGCEPEKERWVLVIDTLERKDRPGGRTHKYTGETCREKFKY